MPGPSASSNSCAASTIADRVRSLRRSGVRTAEARSRTTAVTTPRRGGARTCRRGGARRPIDERGQVTWNDQWGVGSEVSVPTLMSVSRLNAAIMSPVELVPHRIPTVTGLWRVTAPVIANGTRLPTRGGV